ncbi:MAG: putative chaperone of endosialidase [Prokaryotic dsDNA virus sp.]|nr:MAG: putative chaperone of endosialidase [Prokaryotic dsDNA virus sp.]
MSYTLVPSELIVDGAITSAKLDTNIAISGTLGVTGEVTLATHLVMGDNDKIKIGTGGDLEIYHDGSNSYIANSTGNIYIADTNGAVHIQAKLNEESIVCAADGAVTLYHDNSAKLATTSSGVDVTGTLNTDGIVSTVGITVDHSDGTDNISITPTSSGGVLNVRNSSGTSVIALDGRDGQIGIDITGTLTATTLAGTLSTAAQTNITSVGTLTTLTVDDITINGSTISDSGDLTVDVGGNIILDADAGDIELHDAGTKIGQFALNNTGNFDIYSAVSDADIRIRGNDGGSTITALTLDMSAAGAATFNDLVDAKNFKINGGQGSDGQVLTSTGSGVAWEDASGTTINNNADNRVITGSGTANTLNGEANVIIDGESNISFGTQKQDPNWSQFFNAISGNYGGHVSFQNNNVPVTTLGNNFYINNSTANERVLAYPTQQFKLDHQQNFLWESAASSTAGATFSFTEHMRLNANGTLMVGTATNPSYAHRIFADGNSITDGIVRFNDNDVSVGLANVVLQLSFGSDNDCTSASFIYMTDGGGAIGSITAASGTSVSYNTTSDERLKKNIVDASSQLDTIKNIKIREFDWKKNNYHELGVIAQEIKTLVPNAVTEGGDDETKNPFGVDYGKIVPYLIKAVQEQQTIIEDLKTRIETLEG